MMLQTIRERTSGLVLWVIVIVITLSFALWGASSYFDSGGNVVVVKVEGEEFGLQTINQRIQQRRSEAERELPIGSRLSAEQIQQIQDAVIDDIIDEELSRQWAVRSGVMASDLRVSQYIRNEVPAFQVDGKFSRAAYSSYVRSQGYSEPYFENMLVRTSLSTYEMRQAILVSVYETQEMAQKLYAQQEQEREFAYLRVDAARFKPEVVVADSAVEAEYNANKELLFAPEKARLEYVVLDTDTLLQAASKELNILPEDIAARYEIEKATFETEETRRVRHILLTLDDSASEAERADVTTRIASIRDDIAQGRTTFEEAARTYSQDPASATEGGDLGFFGREMMVESFDQAAFALAEGELSEPVKTDFGYHLLRVETIRPAHVKSLDEVSSIIERDLKQEKAQMLLIDKAETLANLAYEIPDSLEPAQQEMGLEVMISDYFDRDAVTGIMQYPSIREAAFSPELIATRHNSEVIQVSDDRRVVIRIKDYHPAEQLTLDQVRDDIVAKLTDAEAARRAEAYARELLASLSEEGTTLESLAQEHALSQPQVVTTTRNDRVHPPEVIKDAFVLGHDATGKASAVALANGDAAVVHLVEVKDVSTEDLSPLELKDFQQMMSLNRATEELAALRTALKDQAKIAIKKEHL